MSWNYRIIKHKDRITASEWYGLHEVYYNSQGEIVGHTDEVFLGNSVKEIQDSLELMLRDISKPVIEEPIQWGKLDEPPNRAD